MLNPPPGAPLVLIVDDNEDNREVYGIFLTLNGYRVETAVDGLDGLLKAASLGPAAVLMDLAMPRLDGWEAIRLLKASFTTNGIPIICLTGYSGATDRQRAIDAGCDVFLTRPLVPDQLLKALARVLEPAQGEALSPDPL
jgi:CheY-like chemotaxis protein